MDNKFQLEKYDLKQPVNIYRHVTSTYQLILATRTVFQEIVDESKGFKMKEVAMENIYISSLVFKEK